jgi:hypothetical protein
MPLRPRSPVTPAGSSAPRSYAEFRRRNEPRLLAHLARHAPDRATALAAAALEQAWLARRSQI